MTEPHMDFRYRDPEGNELEAFKVTKGARWATGLWPNWLRMQRGSKDVNCVYTDSAAPESLFISLDGAEFELAEDAYVIFENGALAVNGDVEFEKHHTKVVPVPPRNLDAPSLEGFERQFKVVDGKLVALSPEEIAALPSVPEIPALTVVETGLHERRRGIQFIKEQQARLVVLIGQERGRAPDRPSILDCRYASQICWIEQRRPNVADRKPRSVVTGYLPGRVHRWQSAWSGCE